MKTPIAWNSLAVGRLLSRHARYRPDHVAVVCGALRFTYRQFDDYVNRWANALQGLGVARGQRVATLLPNCPELLATYWACAKLGAAAVPLSPLLLGEGLASLLNDSRPRVLLHSGESVKVLADAWPRLAAPPIRVTIDGAAGDAVPVAFGAASAAARDTHSDAGEGGHAFAALVADAPATEPGVEVEPDDLLTIMYTSGTTGLPKGIMHTHFIRAMYATLLANAWRIAPESVVLHTGAIVFNGAMVTLFPAFCCGASYVLGRRFDAGEFVDIVERERVTHTMLVPSQIVAILAAPGGLRPERLGSMQCLLSLGAPLHQEHKDRLNAVLPGRFHELYGLTEGFVTILDRQDAVRKSGSVGVPPPFFDMRIVDADGRDCATGEVGEIVGRGPITMAGYLDRPDLTAQAIRDGWLYSGDLGYVDDDGYLYLVDRKKDMIDSGGVKVYPKDVEEIAARHPAVLEVAVFGIPHDEWGETPAAAIVLKPGEVVTEEALRDWINARVAARYQRVARVIVMADFPRNAAGKTLKREMREPFWKGRSGRI